MKVQKYEISRTIDKLKSIVQKNDQFPALGGVLVKDGYLIASNTEMTMQLKLEASKGSYFIIPMKAFDVIKNLPDGEVDIDTEGENIVVIKTKAIKNKYQSYPPEDFSFDITENPDAPGVVINGKSLMEAIGHVIYAAADSSSATQMMGVYFEGGENKIKLVALDGHVVAVDSIPTDGTADMKLIVPKTVAKKLVSMGIIDDVAVTYTKNRAVFKSKEYTIYTRLIEGKYFDYDRFFMAGKMKTYVSRPELVAAMTRAKMCTEEKKPAVFEMNEDQLNIRIADRLTDYQEEWIPNCFDTFFVAAGAGESFGGLLGWDSFEGDYFGIDGTDAWAEDEAKKKMKAITKDELIAAARQCFKVYQSYIGLRNRYDSLKAAIDILRDQNTGFLQTIKEIERLYEAASKEQGITAKYSTEWKEFERYTDALPQEAWIQ